MINLVKMRYIFNTFLECQQKMSISPRYCNVEYTKRALLLHIINYRIPRDLYTSSFALLICWNFSSAALRISSPKVATRSG